MKKKILTMFCLVIISMTYALSQREPRLSNMHFIPKGEFIEDSGKKATIMSFWISNQITNEEFREFWNYAKNNPNEELMWVDISQVYCEEPTSKPKIIRIKYFELLKDTLNDVNWPTESYFEALEFNESPAIGVSEELVKYYCIWKTNITFDNLSKRDKNPVFTYFQPTSLQMKYARKTKPTIFSDNEVGFRIIIFE